RLCPPRGRARARGGRTHRRHFRSRTARLPARDGRRQSEGAGDHRRQGGLALRARARARSGPVYRCDGRRRPRRAARGDGRPRRRRGDGCDGSSGRVGTGGGGHGARGKRAILRRLCARYVDSTRHASHALRGADAGGRISPHAGPDPARGGAAGDRRGDARRAAHASHDARRRARRARADDEGRRTQGVDRAMRHGAAALALLLLGAGPACAFDNAQTFTQGTTVLSVEAGGGSQNDLETHRVQSNLDLWYVGVRYSLLPLAPVGPSVLRGALEVGLGPMYQKYERGRDAFWAGLSAHGRWHFLSLGRFVPYVELGAGAGGTDLNAVEIDSTF